MSDRMTDERLAELKARAETFGMNKGWLLELVQALEAERQYAEELGRVPLTESQAAKMMRHIRDLEAQLARVRELPGKWRDEANMTGDTLGCKYGITAEECADELEAALQSAAGAGSNQPEVDNTKSEG